MKKILLVLLILTVFVTTNVYADGAAFEGKIVMKDQWTIDTGAPARPSYTSHEFKLEVGDTEYEAYCIRPGKGASGKNSVTCQELNPALYGMTYAAAQDAAFNASDDKQKKDIIYRTLGIMDRASAVHIETSGGSEDGLLTGGYEFFVVQWHHYLVWPNGDVANDVDPVHAGKVAQADIFKNAFAYASSHFYKYWVGRPGHETITVDDGGDGSGGVQENGDSSNGRYFSYTKTEYSDKTRYIIKANPSVGTATGVNVTGSAGLNFRVTRPWDGSSIIVDVYSNGGSGCNGKLTVTGRFTGISSTSNTKAYLCTMNSAGTSKQQYIAFAPGDVGDRFNVTAKCDDCVEQTSTDINDSNIEHTCRDTVNTDYYKVAEVHNCCLEGRTSKLEEYSLDELFCSGKNSKIEATYFTNKCYNSGYSDDVIWGELESSITISSSVETVAKYCQARCTERMEVTVPEAILSATGKFFKLKEQNSRNGLTSGPIIDGTKRCTVKIDYRKARKNYETVINDEVSAWNSYQKSKAQCDVTENDGGVEYSVDTPAVDFTLEKKWKTCTTEDDQTVEPGKSVTVYAKNEDGACANGTTKTCEATNTTNCKFDSYKDEEHSDEATVTREACTQKYTIYTLNGNAPGITKGDSVWSIDYFTVKTDEDFPYDKEKWTGLKIKRNGEGKTGTESYDKYTRTASSGDCATKIAAAKDAKKSEGYEYKSGDTSYKSFQNSTHQGYAQKNTPSIHSGYCNAANGYSSSFTTAKTRASDIENIVYGCENFLAGAKKGSSLGNNDRFYTLKPTASFNYMQIILEGTNRKTKILGDPLIYTPNCNITFHEGDDTTSNRATIDSDLFGSGSEEMVDLGNIKRLIATDAIPKDDRTQKKWDKHVRTNAYYEGYCTFDPPENHDGEVTIYPGPTFTTLTSSSGRLGNGKTGHKLQYALYLTAFSGQYETWWELTGLGGSSKTITKFTKAFNEQPTCAEQGYNYSAGDAESKKNNTTVPFTCNLELLEGGMRIGFCDPGVDTSGDHGNCIPHVQSVYEFRVVDPANIFPNERMWDHRADNWRRSKDGQWRKVVNDIQSQAKNAYSPDNLSYSFKLNPASIKAIKEYNKGKVYADAPLSCKANNTSIDDGDCGTIQPSSSCLNGNKFKYANSHCTSNFIDNLNHNVVNGTHLNYTVWQGKSSLSNIRDGSVSSVHWA